MTCALWSVRRGSAQYELCRDEAEAASLAWHMEADESASPLGVQFPDGRLVRVHNWAAFREVEARMCRLYAEARAKQRAKPAPVTRLILDPFQGQPVTVLDTEPGWLGAP